VVSVGQRLEGVGAVADDQADRHVAGHPPVQVAVLAFQRPVPATGDHDPCPGGGRLAGLGLAIGRVRPPVGPLVDQEDLEHRPVADRPVDPRRVVGVDPGREILEEGPAGAGREEVDAPDGVTGSRRASRRDTSYWWSHDRPIARGWGPRRGTGGRFSSVRLYRVAAPETRRGSRRPWRWPRFNQVLPGRAIVEGGSRRGWVVGVDMVAAVGEEVGPGPGGSTRRSASPRAPGPMPNPWPATSPPQAKPDVGPVPGRGPEPPLDVDAPRLRRGQVLEGHPVAHTWPIGRPVRTILAAKSVLRGARRPRRPAEGP